FSRDWSSGVCCSDLLNHELGFSIRVKATKSIRYSVQVADERAAIRVLISNAGIEIGFPYSLAKHREVLILFKICPGPITVAVTRPEERRVGRESNSP